MIRRHAQQTSSFAEASRLTKPTRVIEVGERTVGIAVPERGGVRFFSSDKAFDTLEGTLFRSVVKATRAARSHARAVP